MKHLLFLFLFTSLSIMMPAQSLKSLVNKSKSIIQEGTKTNKSNSSSNNLVGSNLSNADILDGLREALKVGTQNASGKLNKTNGFFTNQLIKILMPPEAKKIESTLRSFGFNKQCDNLILSMNRAAEDAAGQAVPIFVNAIMHMTINDGLSILRGGNNAATIFLKQATSSALTTAFRPVIENSLNKVGATRYWSDVFTTYNKLPITRNKVNTDLAAYVTERALNGLFTTVAEEEANIRQNPSARVSGILQKVFGGE
jgi:hypothetical protein